MLDSIPKPVVFAHRGASKAAPENTLAAFRLAIEQKADALELDVQLTADKEVVVFHDNILSRTTNGEGYLKNQDFYSLNELNAGKLFSPAYQNEKIPSLAQVFDNFGDSTYYNIELKNLLTPLDDLPARVISIIMDYQLENHVLISSFNPIALSKIEKTCPSLPKGILIKGRFPINIQRFLLFPFLSYQSVHFSYNSISSNQVKSIRTSGKLAFTYTINTPSEILSSLRYGVDGIFTDDPKIARKMISSLENESH